MSRRTVAVPKNTFVQLTQGDVTALRFQNVGAGNLLIFGVVGAVAPADTDGGILYPPYTGEDANVTLAQLFPDTPTANRVYAYSSIDTAVSVSHV